MIRALLIALALLVGAPAQADERRDREARLQAIQERIQTLTTRLRDTQGRRNEVRAQLERLERDLGRIHKQLRTTETRRDDARRRLRDLERRAAEEQTGLDRERLALADSLRSAYAEGRQPLIKLLLNQEAPNRIGRLVGYHAYIQRDRIRRVKAIRRRLDQALTLRADIRLQAARLEELILDQRRQEQQLQTGATARERLLTDLEKALRAQGDRIARLRIDEQTLERLLDRIADALGDIPEDLGEDQPLPARRGQLAWPVQGRLQLRFGKPRMGDGRPSRGVLIRAEEGRAIRAVARGRVVFADWLNGVGLLLVIEHADGFLSLYGHNQSLYKEVGEWVETGERIATVGQSGGRARPGLYFEMRRNGKPVDPARWCKKPRGNRVG